MRGKGWRNIVCIRVFQNLAGMTARISMISGEKDSSVRRLFFLALAIFGANCSLGERIAKA